MDNTDNIEKDAEEILSNLDRAIELSEKQAEISRQTKYGFLGSVMALLVTATTLFIDNDTLQCAGCVLSAGMLGFAVFNLCRIKRLENELTKVEDQLKQ